MEWTFQNAEPARMLHGTAIESVDRCGVWMELLDTRPLRELRQLHNIRRYRRMATDLPVQAGTIQRSTFQTSDLPTAVAFADLNGDGIGDMVLGLVPGIAPQVSVRLGTPAGTFTTPEEL